MKGLAIAAAVALMIGGCAHAPQVNRTAKADKYVAPKKVAAAPMPSPNQVVKKRWFPKYKIKWLHPK
jgi:hypothetical protein